MNHFLVSRNPVQPVHAPDHAGPGNLCHSFPRIPLIPFATWLLNGQYWSAQIQSPKSYSSVRLDNRRDGLVFNTRFYFYSRAFDKTLAKIQGNFRKFILDVDVITCLITKMSLCRKNLWCSYKCDNECKYRRLGVFRHKSTSDNPVSDITIAGVHLPGAFGATVDNVVP